MVVHFDHGLTFDRCMEALKWGFSSIMFDGSTGTMEENTNSTSELVRIAHAMSASVEGEIGHVGQADTGDNDAQNFYTTPEEAVKFVSETGVDALAVAIGTAHSVYKSKPVLDIDRLKAIHQALDTPLVLHGGSGLSEDDFRNTIQAGIANAYIQVINIVDIVAELVDVQEPLAHNLSILPVFGGCLANFCHCVSFLLEHKLLHRVHRVRYIGKSKDIGGGVLYIHTPVTGNINTSFDRTVAIQRRSHFRPYAVEHIILRILEDTQSLAGTLEFFCEDLVEFFEIGDVIRNHSIHCAPHRIQQVHRVNILVAIFVTGNAEPLATGNRYLPGKILRHTGTKLAVNEHIVIGEGRNAGAVSGHYVTGIAEQIHVYILVPHQEQVVVVIDHVIAFENHKTHIINGSRGWR